MRWIEPSTHPHLHRRECHIWHLNAAFDSTDLDDLIAFLSDEEQQRALRLICDKKRRLFTFFRVGCRILLGRYVNKKPDEIRFSYGLNGKPTLSTGPQIHFNLSHSEEQGLLAVAPFEVGIDLETEKERDYTGVARRFYSIEEAQRVKNSPNPLATFYRIWTAKEALLKADGTGITAPLNDVTVPADPTQSCVWRGQKYLLTPLTEIENGYATIAWLAALGQQKIRLYRPQRRWITKELSI